MGLFNRKNKVAKEQKDQNIRKTYKDVTLSDGTVISIWSIENVKNGKIRHRDGRITEIKLAGISMPHNIEDCILLKPEKYLAFEVLQGAKIDENKITRMIQSYLQNRRNDSLCQYIGEYNEVTMQFDRKSAVVENFVKNNIAKQIEMQENVEMSKIQKNYQRAQSVQNSMMREQMIEKTNSYNRYREEEKARRKNNAYFISKGKTNSNGREFYNYDGVNLNTGDILRLRNIDKVGKDGSGTYLYAGYLDSTYDESNKEVLTGEPKGRYVCFEMKKRLEDIEKDGDSLEIRQLLSLLSLSDKKDFTNNGTLNYIGSINERWQVDRSLKSNSPSIRAKIEQMRRTYEARTRIEKGNKHIEY